MNLKKIFSYTFQFLPMKLLVDNSSPILLYHSVLNHIPRDIKDGLDNVSTEILYEQLYNLKKYYEIVTVDEYLSLKNKRGYACITFDDGYKSVIDNGFEIFESLKVPITIFINTCTLENKIFWRDKVRFILNNSLVEEFEMFSTKINKVNNQDFYKYSKYNVNNSSFVENEIDKFLIKKNIDIKLNNYSINLKKHLKKNKLIYYGNHTHSHYVMSSLSYNEQYKEISKAKKILNKYDINQSKIFSLPFGGENDFNQDTLSALNELGYKAMLMSRNNINYHKTKQELENIILLERFMPLDNSLTLKFKTIFLKQLLSKQLNCR
jgi:peptidoglycan/xylan/chitin deacetylase (PgdA/CDA1 family)